MRRVEQATLSDGVQVVASGLEIELEQRVDDRGRPAMTGVLELNRGLTATDAHAAGDWRLHLADGSDREIIIRRAIGADLGGAVLLFETGGA